MGRPLWLAELALHFCLRAIVTTGQAQYGAARLGYAGEQPTCTVFDVVTPTCCVHVQVMAIRIADLAAPAPLPEGYELREVATPAELTSWIRAVSTSRMSDKRSVKQIFCHSSRLVIIFRSR
jgi:hypothetical protein